ncbi:MAG: TetR/AcrR family transcriptional regulator [Verrucomicrobiota bacterium]
MATAKSKAESGAATRQRLLEAAEELFSERGFEAVSVRDITELAGANVAAVNYHFNGRDQLVDQVMERYINPVNEERLARLETLERKAGRKPVALEELLDAFVRPFVTQVRRSELSEKMFFKLMGRCFGDDGMRTMPDSVEQGFQAMLMRFMKAFGKALPDLDHEELLWRIHFMVGAMIHTMAHAETLNRFTHGASGNPSMERTLSRFIRFCSAGLRQQAKEKVTKKKGPQDEFEF